MRAGGCASDIYAITHDPLLELLQEWDYLSDDQQEMIEVQKPKLVEIAHFASDVREWTTPFMEILDSKAFQITRDVLTSVAAVAILAGDFFPPTAMATAGLTPAAISTITTRIFPLAQRVSRVIGGADAFQKVTTFLNEMKESHGSIKKDGWEPKGSPAPKDLQSINSQTEACFFARNFLNKTKRYMGRNKWIDNKYIYQIDKANHHGNLVEIEVFRAKGSQSHEAVLDCFGRFLRPGKIGRYYNGK